MAWNKGTSDTPGWRNPKIVQAHGLVKESDLTGPRARGSVAPMELDAGSLLYEDDWLVAVAKPAGIPVHATLDPHRDHLEAALGRWLVARDGAVGYLTLQHRLDVDTSGVVVLARRPEANLALARAFADRTVRKTYLALTARPDVLPQDAWTVRNHLASKKNQQPPVAAVRSGGDPAHTDFVLRQAAPSALLVEARPRTGRRHQIRVHLADAGMPILGDGDYGIRDARADSRRAPRLMLHAWRLELAHPGTGAPWAVTCPVPADMRATAMRLAMLLPGDELRELCE